jgi:Domain of unknown function (DUF4258)
MSCSAYKAGLRTIRDLWRTGEVVWTHHAIQRLKERGLTDLDVGNVILNGRVTQHRRSMEGWKYTVEGKTIEDEDAACSVAIKGRLIIITVIG